MSGASALASARRRRADPIPQTITPIVQETKNNNEVEEKQVLTPLKILQEHDIKLKELENSLEKNVEKIVKNILNKTEKESSKKVETFDSSPLLEKFGILTKNFEELKLLFIKNQNIILDTTNEVIKTKDKIVSIENNILDLENYIKNKDKDKDTFNNNSNNNSSELMNNNFAEMLFKNMLSGDMSMFNDKVGEDEDEDADEDVDVDSDIESKRLNIHDNESQDSNEIDNIGEITLTESDLNSIKTDMISELQEENLNLDENKADLIEVSENESQE